MQASFDVGCSTFLFLLIIPCGFDGFSLVGVSLSSSFLIEAKLENQEKLRYLGGS